MSGHTPGPWKVEAHDPCMVVTNPCRLGDAAIAVYFHGPEGRSEEEARANARLIAAAPDLLEAANHALEVIDVRAHDEEYWMLSDAINKAEDGA